MCFWLLICAIAKQSVSAHLSFHPSVLVHIFYDHAFFSDGVLFLVLSLSAAC